MVRADGLRLITQLVSDIVAYDSYCFPAPRQAFLQRWLQAPHQGLAAINSRGITGCGVARRCRSGFKIGPLFADDTEIALQLLDGLAGACEGGDLHIDVPAPTFTTTRMAGSLMTKPDNRMPRKTAPEEISATSLALTAARGTSWLIALNRRFPC